MMKVDIPGVGQKCWEYLLLDVNGTLAVDGALVDGLLERIAAMSQVLGVRLITANAHGNADRHAAALGVTLHQVQAAHEATQKRDLALNLGAERCIAIGNGANDTLVLRAASLGIAVLGNEGLATEALQSADLVAPSIQVALDCLLAPTRLAATLRR